MSSKHGNAPLVTFRNRRGESVDTISMSATVAKKEFGRVLDTVIRGGVVVIERHASPKAVMLSIEDYETLAADASRELDTLSEEFDALLARMQTPQARKGMRSAFDASPAELGQAAAKAARKRA